jgi:hypothetical protein
MTYPLRDQIARATVHRNKAMLRLRRLFPPPRCSRMWYVCALQTRKESPAWKRPATGINAPESSDRRAMLAGGTVGPKRTRFAGHGSMRLRLAERGKRKESSSFLKKRTKKLLFLRVKVFCFFFSKKKYFLAPLPTSNPLAETLSRNVPVPHHA